ncbi:MAG: peptidoglycan DD-metalloendopeptidase family protein [Sphingomonadaceae bacterium]
MSRFATRRILCYAAPRASRFEYPKTNPQGDIIAGLNPGRIVNRLARYFPEREIFVRSNGEVRFIRISTSLQLRTVAVLAVIALLWLGATAATLVQRVIVERERAALGERAAVVAKSAGRVAAFQSSVDDIAERIEQRQHRLDNIVSRYFGKVESAPTPRPIAMKSALPETQRLAEIEQQQMAFATALSEAAARRSAKAEAVLRRYGVNPGKARRAQIQGVGGPYVPVANSSAALERLGQTLTRLDRLERVLMAIPSTRPATPMALSSRFGVRSDPFTGGAAMHTGLDIRGAYGQPIYAAAPGRVIRVGRWSGYGNVVVIDHGHGIETRYGHLSGFDVRPGATIKAGEQIARMGSTGRSTGNHLHFEVRINGRAVNPRPYLEASSDVLEIKAGAGRRFTGDTGRS